MDRRAYLSRGRIPNFLSRYLPINLAVFHSIKKSMCIVCTMMNVYDPSRY
jgi:hypothetical protein